MSRVASLSFRTSTRHLLVDPCVEHRSTKPPEFADLHALDLAVATPSKPHIASCCSTRNLPDNKQQKQRTNRVFKSLHKPLTYLGVERTLFYFVCVGAVGAFNLFNSILAGIALFVCGVAFGHWVANSNPAFLRILAKPERYKLRYDAETASPVWRW